MDIRKVKKLIDLIEESSVSEIEIREGEDSVRITRTLRNTSGEQAVATCFTPVNSALHNAGNPPAATPETGAAQPQGTVIESPMVGTFYTASSPGSPAFVSVGQRVVPGDTLCIIEAMKILNQIESEVSGVVVSLLVDDGQPVEYGQPLMVVDGQ